MSPEQETPQQQQPDFVSDFYEADTVGAFLDKISQEAGNTTKKGEALEFLFREIATADPALNVEDIDLYTNWARAKNDPLFSTQDKGIDLVARLNDGTYAGIQCKFYGRGRSIQKADLDSFLAKLATRGSDNLPFFSQGWIVSTTKLAQGLLQELNAHVCPIQDISIYRYENRPLRTGFQFDKREPRPYQAAAIESIELILPITKRGKLVMACGTGKTFTALRAMEKLVPRNGRVLVCAPTIALVSQIRAEWLRQTNARIDARVVCSDAGAGKSRSRNESVLAIQELECPVTTDPSRLAEFLKDTSLNSIKVVFTTYQSLVRVKEAQEAPSVPDFDLAIADEAHKTTGASKNRDDPETRGFRMIHNGNDIRARMRLYMTATPRVYSNSSSLKAQGYDVTDMDDTDIYGNTLYEYDFKKAVEQGYLCDYRLVMLGVHEGALTEPMKAMVRQGEAGKISYDEMARVFGTMLAIRGNSSSQDSAPTGIMHRTIAFANTVARSKWYTDTMNSPQMKGAVTRKESAITGQNAPAIERMEISCKHLDASHQVVDRIDALRDLQEAKKNNKAEILCNVGLFSEGVDVPSLNAVAFLDPRSSTIDIVQAVGRVMRRPENPEDKERGYVIVPVVVPENASFAEAFKTADERYKPVLSVIAALQSHDENLAEILESKLVIQEISPNDDHPPPIPGNGENSDPSPEPEQSPQLRLGLSDEDRQGIIAFIVGKTGLTPDSKGKIAADSIKNRVTKETSKMIRSGIGPDLGRLLSVSRNEKDGWKEACTLAALLVLNAMLVHRRLQDTAQMQRIEKLHMILQEEDLARALEKSWSIVLKKDYRPIFEPALSVLQELKKWPDLCRSILRGLIECADNFGPSVSKMGWDHAGPLYHSVLGTAKSDGAFYTHHVSALMLARLAIHDGMADWRNPASISKLRVMDPACGTGTLLMAVLQELKRRAGNADSNANLDSLHRELVENSLAGLDINRHATQLAASNLTIASENVDYDRMHIYTMKRGMQEDGTVKTGSLELLDTKREGDIPQDLFQRERTLAGIGAQRSVGEEGEARFPCEGLDLVIMNPPFTNAADKGGHLPTEHKRRITKREQKIAQIIEARDPSLKGVTNYNSIEPFFTPLADALVCRDTGTLAQVMPATACTGSMALEKRRWIAKNWHVERIVSNHDPKKFMFSENTDIHEVLMVCRRTPTPTNHHNTPPPRTKTEHISLRRRPESGQEAHECIEAILGGSEEEWAKWCTRAWIAADRISSGDWKFVQWHQPSLEWTVQGLESHPALVPLGSVATMGPTGRQARGTWEKCEEKCEELEATVRSFYSRSEARRQTIKGEPEQLVRPRGGGSLEWSRENGKASRLLVATGGATDSGRVMAIHADAPSFGSGWQPVLVDDECAEPAIAGWLNSTPGRLLYLNRRAKKLTYPQYSLEDISTIPVPKDLGALGEATHSCWNEIVKPGRESAECVVRMTLDDAAARILGISLEEVTGWRRMLAQEPTVSGKVVPE